MYDLILDDNKLTFKTIEKKIYKYACDCACVMFSKILEEIDEKLMNERNPKIYREKGMRHTCIKTIMGTVEIDRRIYEYRTKDGKRAYKYLLDEFLHVNATGHMSENLVENIIDNISEVSYRKTSSNVELMTNQHVSHTAVWNVVQNVGAYIKEKEKRKIELNKQGKLKGMKETKVLFQEQDGIWLNMQGKDRPKKAKSKKRELKLEVSYEGWKRRNCCRREEYAVVNKTACAGFESSKEFRELTDATIAEIYNTDEIQTRIINGDGASWIKAGLGDEGVYYQLDPFHKSQAVIRAVDDKKEARKLIDLLHCGKVEDSLNMVTEMMIKNNNDDKKLKKLETLYNYLVDNKEGLIPYQLRSDILLPKPPKGIIYRHLGTMEHNICDILAQRIKGRKMSWSVTGAQNLAKILAEKASHRIYDILDEISGSVITSEKLNRIIEVTTLSAAKLNKKQAESKVYPIPKGELPYTGSPLTAGRKAIRDIFNYITFSNMSYI